MGYINSDYTVIYSKRKTIALEVTRDLRLVVRAPLSCRKRDIDQMIDRHAGWIETAMDRQRRRAAAHPDPGNAEAVELKKLAQAVLPDKVARYAGIMGLRPTGVKITGAKRRFGSCSAKNSLCFSQNLMTYDDRAIDYVVVHELAHIRHKNHGGDFYALIAEALPDYKERRKLLRE